MAVGLEAPQSLKPVAGVRLSAVEAGIRYRNRTDLVMMELAPGTAVAAVFTRNAFRAAPVLVAEQHLASASPRYLLINSGNANAGTGQPGLEAARASCTAVAAATGCNSAEVLPFSTGVIGELLPVERIESALPSAVQALADDAWLAAARGIMTTDTLPKGVSRTVPIGDGEITITGIAKGSGMIHPDMATMLAYVATDAVLPADVLQQSLKLAVDRSFNAVTVDGDTSTNDACVLAATGASGVSVGEGTALDVFQAALDEVCMLLAQAIIRDGEGATKFVTIDVVGAVSEEEARRVGFTVAHSPLVKTALFASDPNWGRILAAVGRAGVEDLDVGRIDIYLDDVRIVQGGGRDAAYTEAQGQAVMEREEIAIRVELNRGEACARIWTSDLSHEYVRINAEYRS